METMDRDPAGRSILQAAHPQNGERVLQPLGAIKPLVRQDPVITEGDAQQAKDRHNNVIDDNARPTEKPRQQRQ